MIQICSINDLKDKEVVSICDGCRLGFISDVEIDICSGRIVSIIVPGELKCFSFGKSEELRIGWERIDKIGSEIILVNVSPSEYPVCKEKCVSFADKCGKKEDKKKKKNFFW